MMIIDNDKLMALILLIVLKSCGMAAPLPQPVLETLSLIESSHGRNTVGDNGKALGRYQIRKLVVQDYNKANKASFSHRDMFCDTKAKMVATWYIKHHVARYKKANNTTSVPLIVYAGIWNGGPRWASTLAGTRGTPAAQRRLRSYMQRFITAYKRSI